jgi:hypothetical protein
MSESANNWLVCASCLSPIASASELLSDEALVLRNAVYAYKLDMLEREVTVYSATNTADHRFDVVRANLSSSVDVPKTSRHTIDERESLRVFLRHFQLISINELPGNSEETPEQLLVELDRLAEQNNTSEESEEHSNDEEPPQEPSQRSGEDVESTSSDSKRRKLNTEIICNRIETSYSEPTDEYSWFPSYCWTVASCIHCHEHLGWVFWRKTEGSETWDLEFLSLIVTRLREKFIPNSTT